MRESAAAMAPTWDTFDPSAISGTSILAQDYSPTGCFGGVRAPTTAGTYTLKFRAASAWKLTLPGGSENATTKILTKVFAAGEALLDVLIVEIIKTGSTAGTWEMLA